MLSHNHTYNLRPKKVCKVVKRKRLTEAEKDQESRKLFSMIAMRFYNERTGKNYVLEEPWKMRCGSFKQKTCVGCHINFVAQNKDVDDALPEMFFAELTAASGSKEFRTQFCVSLGPSDSDSLPEYGNHGCFYCRTTTLVRHPKAVGWCKNYWLNPPSIV